MKQLSDSFRFLWDLGHTQVTINTGKYELTGFCCGVWSQEDTSSFSPEEEHSVSRLRLWPARRGSCWWNHRTSDSRLSGAGDPSRVVLLWTPCRDAQGLTSKWTLCIYWSELWSVTAGIEQEYPIGDNSIHSSAATDKTWLLIDIYLSALWLQLDWCQWIEIWTFSRI